MFRTVCVDISNYINHLGTIGYICAGESEGLLLMPVRQLFFFKVVDKWLTKVDVL